MTELARGKVLDRPWGKTFGALALRGITAQLTLHEGGKAYRVAYRGGAVVGAYSPLASDAAARIALTSNLISSTQVADIVRAHQATPQADEIDIVVDRARLSPDQGLRLRRRAVAQRAARTFAIDRGDFVFEDQITIPTVPGSELDARAVIYLGARQNLSETRLATELGQLGAWFQLKPEAVEDLAQYGFGPVEKPVLEKLLIGADLEELEAAAPGIEQRMVRSIVYALTCFNECVAEAQSRTPPRRASQPVATMPLPSRTQTPSMSPISRTQTPSMPPGRTMTQQKLVPRPPVSTPPPVQTAPDTIDDPDELLTFAKSPDDPAHAFDPPTTFKKATPAKVDTGAPTFRRRTSSAPPVARVRAPATAQQIAEVKRLIDQRVALLDRKTADHFTLLDVPRDATSEVIRAAYFKLARLLHPDKLASLGISDDARNAHRLMAQVNTAFAVLNDPTKRFDYIKILERGGEAAVKAEEAKAEALAMRALDAEESYRRGEMALRRDQLTTAIAEFKRAVELDPETADYQGMFAWAQFCASPDKMAASTTARGALEKASAMAPKAPTSRFLLGRVERMLGRDVEALKHFQAVLKIMPGHSEAASEARVIEARLAAKKPGR